jgi:ABC-type Na+ transport system ATPase subunit NatA
MFDRRGEIAFSPHGITIYQRLSGREKKQYLFALFFLSTKRKRVSNLITPQRRFFVEKIIL